MKTLKLILVLPLLVLATIALVWPGTADNQEQHQHDHRTSN